jgi:hypothetical protein
MKHVIISLLLLGGVVALSTTEASAIVCPFYFDAPRLLTLDFGVRHPHL